MARHYLWPCVLALAILSVLVPCSAADPVSCWTPDYSKPAFPEQQCVISWDDATCKSPQSSVFAFTGDFNSVNAAAATCCKQPVFADAVKLKTPAIYTSSWGGSHVGYTVGTAVCGCAKGAQCNPQCYTNNPAFSNGCPCFKPDFQTTLDCSVVDSAAQCRYAGVDVFILGNDGAARCCDRLGRSKAWGRAGPAKAGFCATNAKCIYFHWLGIWKCLKK